MKYALLSLIAFLAVTFLYTLPSFYVYDPGRVPYLNVTLSYTKQVFSKLRGLLPGAVVVDPKQVFMAWQPKSILKITADFNYADLVSKVCYNRDYQPICTQTSLVFKPDADHIVYADYFGNFWIGYRYPVRIGKSALWKTYAHYRYCRNCIRNYRYSDRYSIPGIPFIVNFVMDIYLPFRVSFSNVKYILYNEQPLSFFISCSDVCNGGGMNWRVPFNAFVFAYYRCFQYCGSDFCSLGSICAEWFSPFNWKSSVGTWTGGCMIPAYNAHYVVYYERCSITYNYTMIPSNSLWAYNNYTRLYRTLSCNRWYTHCPDWSGPRSYCIYWRFCYITSGHPSTGKPNIVFYPINDFTGAYYCGDHICSLSAGENKDNCPEDCSFKEGDGICQVNIGENYGNSPEDCLYACNDGYCSPKENAYTCPEDCSNICGDGFCNPNAGENCHTCPVDCGSCVITCGDNICAYPNETVLNCPSDCKSICGDGICSESEDPVHCPSDCPGAYSDTDRALSAVLSMASFGATMFLFGRRI